MTLLYHKLTKLQRYLNFQTEFKYEPGDHVGVMPCNRTEIVDAVLKRLKGVDNYEKPVQLQVLTENLTPTGTSNIIFNISTYSFL